MIKFLADSCWLWRRKGHAGIVGNVTQIIAAAATTTYIIPSWLSIISVPDNFLQSSEIAKSRATIDGIDIALRCIQTHVYLYVGVKTQIREELTSKLKRYNLLFSYR